jgi:hypothetical protein
MKRALVFAAAVGLGSSVGGCRSGQRGDSFRPEVVAGDQAAIYVYRERGMGGAMRVVIDQQDAGDLKAGQYLVKIVKPGEHIVRAEGVSSVARSVLVGAGDAGYVELASSGLGKHPILSTPDEATARERIAGSARVP